jgi:hypothetical protein
MTELIFFYIFKIPPISKCSEPVFVNLYGTQESIPPAYVAWRAGKKNKVVVPARQDGNRFLVYLKGLQIPSQYTPPNSSLSPICTLWLKPSLRTRYQKILLQGPRQISQQMLFVQNTHIPNRIL